MTRTNWKKHLLPNLPYIFIALFAKTGTFQEPDPICRYGQDKEKGDGAMTRTNWKKHLLPNLPYIFIALFATKAGQGFRLAPGTNLSEKLLSLPIGFSDAFSSTLPSFHPDDLLTGILIALGIRIVVYVKGKNAKKFRKNREYGSARWGTVNDIAPYADPVFGNNIILTQTESLTMNSRPKDPKTARNKNVLIIGGSGSGKTRFWLKPNLNNIILTQTESLTMNSRPKDPKTARNKNVLIIGGSGSGKTRFWLKPNLMQCTLTQTESLTMNSRPKDPKTARNKNVLIIGGSGSGKTRFWLKPNLMQCTSKTYPVSFVVTDPKGDIVITCGKMLLHFGYKLKILNTINFQKSMHYNPFAYKGDIVITCGKMLLHFGYKLKILNTINFQKSMHYNPFAYIHSEKDILKVVTALIANTKGEGKAGDDFWVKAETLLYTALIGYIHYEAPEEEQNFATLIEMINAMEVREDDEEFKNPVDLMFDDLKAQKPNHFAVRQYAKFKLSAGKTAKSILISCGARLAPFDIQELRDLTAYDELELDTLGDRKTALFLIMSDTDDTFNFLISLCYTQLFNLLCEKADDV